MVRLPRIDAVTAAKIDEELMHSLGFSIDQLMELAGQAVAHCVYAVHPPTNGSKVLVLAGPGNNGGDGLVASRHLSLLGYRPTVYYPKPSKSPLFDGLQTQLRALELPIIGAEELGSAFEASDFVVDSLFGFSFKPPVRGVFVPVMELLAATKKPVLAVDIPSSWNVDTGPCGEYDYNPPYLISLTAPKNSANFYKGRHFVGGRFISKDFAAKYGFAVPPYEATKQIWEETD